MDFNILSTAQGQHLRKNHTFKIILQQFKTQVTKSQVCSIHCYNIKNQPSISLSKHKSTFKKKVSIPFLGTKSRVCCLPSINILNQKGTSLEREIIGTHHRNLLKSSVTVSRVTCFIPWATQKTVLAKTAIKYVEDLEK